MTKRGLCRLFVCLFVCLFVSFFLSGKRRRKNSDWQISFFRSVQSCVEPCSALFQENGAILDISSLVFNELKRSSDE